MTLRTTPGAALGIACSLFASAALAQPTAGQVEPSAEQKQQARELMSAGRAARANHRAKEALQAFVAADEIMHVPPTSLELARSQVASGLWVEALHSLDRIQAMPVQAREPEQFGVARAEAATLQSELLRRIPVVTLEFSDDPARRAARLTVDGAVEPLESDGGLHLNPGQHRIVARVEGRQAEVEVNAQEGVASSAYLDFGAQRTPTPAPTLAASERALPAHEAARNGAASTAVWVLGGVTVAAIATGTVTGLMGRKRYADLQQRCAPDCSPDAAAQVTRLYTAANLSFAIGAASGIAALVVYLSTGNRPTSTAELTQHASRLRVGVGLDRGQSFATLNGSF